MFNVPLDILMNHDAYLKMIEAQRAWDAMVWQNMQACPWLFKIPMEVSLGETWG